MLCGTYDSVIWYEHFENSGNLHQTRKCFVCSLNIEQCKHYTVRFDYVSFLLLLSSSCSCSCSCVISFPFCRSISLNMCAFLVVWLEHFPENSFWLKKGATTKTWAYNFFLSTLCECSHPLWSINHKMYFFSTSNDEVKKNYVLLILGVFIFFH